jgi:protein O-GlcNAc transferase
MTGRNDTCPCGSGKKYKKCCAVNQPAYATNAKNVQAASQQLLEAVALHQAGELDAAEAAYRAILLRAPNDSDALHYLGVLAFQKKRYSDAAALIEQAIAIKDDIPAFHCNLGNARMRLPDYDAARRAYEQACRLDPRFAVAFFGLSNALLAGGQAREASAAARQAIALAPQFVDALVALGDALLADERIDEAEQSYRQSLALRPDVPAVLVKRAEILTRFGQLDEAEACLAQAMRCDPGYEPAYLARLMNLNYRSSDPGLLVQAHRDWAARFAPHDTTRPMRAGRRAGARLRVAYVSADFRRHALRFFIRPILRHHDRTRFEVFCYFNHPQADADTRALSALSEHWIDCHRMSDAEFAQRIVDDEIDVLIDLSGHTCGNRLPALAMKPAPVQASMLGYLNTSGLKAIDYRIVDACTCPPGAADAGGGEALARLPDCQWCYEPDAGADAPDAPPPALTNGHVTFGCFHNLAKVTPQQLDLFAQILRARPEAHLLMVAWGEQPRQRLLRHFTAAGVGTRVRIVAPLDHLAYLALYDQIDIGLDSFPYTGGTTSMESLWMGVPFVTLRGATQASNGGASILSNLGLPEFIADDAQDYVRIAVQMSGDVDRLGQLRRTLRARLQQSPLMDAPRYVRALEALYLGW